MEPCKHEWMVIEWVYDYQQFSAAEIFDTSVMDNAEIAMAKRDAKQTLFIRDKRATLFMCKFCGERKTKALMDQKT